MELQDMPLDSSTQTKQFGNIRDDERDDKDARGSESSNDDLEYDDISEEEE